jgi:hypothetical protein
VAREFFDKQYFGQSLERLFEENVYYLCWVNIDKVKGFGELVVTKDENNVIRFSTAGQEFARFEGQHLVEFIVRPYINYNKICRSYNPFYEFFTGRDCEYLRKVSFAGHEHFNDNMLQYAFDLKTLEVPDLKMVGDNFLKFSQIGVLNAPKLQKVGDNFLYHNESLKTLNTPELEHIGKNGLYNNNEIKGLQLPKVKTLQDGFMAANTRLLKANMPKLRKVGAGCHPLFYDMVLAKRK